MTIYTYFYIAVTVSACVLCAGALVAQAFGKL